MLPWAKLPLMGGPALRRVDVVATGILGSGQHELSKMPEAHAFEG